MNRRENRTKGTGLETGAANKKAVGRTLSHEGRRILFIDRTTVEYRDAFCHGTTETFCEDASYENYHLMDISRCCSLPLSVPTRYRPDWLVRENELAALRRRNLGERGDELLFECTQIVTVCIALPLPHAHNRSKTPGERGGDFARNISIGLTTNATLGVTDNHV